MKVICPTCGIAGFIEHRGNNYRIKHYAGYDGNQWESKHGKNNT